MQNDDRGEFEQPMDPNKPFAVYTKCQEKCQSFAADAKEPITKATMINTGLTHVIATWLMITAYRQWKSIPNSDKTWSSFKEHFNKAFNELQELNEISAGGIGYVANAM